MTPPTYVREALRREARRRRDSVRRQYHRPWTSYASSLVLCALQGGRPIVAVDQEGGSIRRLPVGTARPAGSP